VVSDSGQALSAAVLESIGGVELAPLTGAENQLWKIDQLPDGTYRIASQANKRVLTATIRITPGNGVALEAFTGDDAQRWVITAP
jgi:hypothetical protein